MTKGKRKFFRIAIIILIVIICFISIAILILSRQSATLDQRIAEFEAKRKIPDSENAAVIYEKLFADANFTSIFEDDIFKKMSAEKVYREPWKSNDYPEAAEWLKNRQDIMDELLKAVRFDKCYFPLPNSTNEFFLSTIKFGKLRSCALLMVYAAQNDIAEGRLDDSIEKYRCIIKIGQNICQQPLLVNSYVGWVIEALSLEKLNKLILERNINEQQLNQIEEFPVQTQDTWKNKLPEIQLAEQLYEEKQKQSLTYFQRIQYSILLMRIKIVTGGQLFRDIKDTRQTYLRYLVIRRANRIFIGLRRYKNKNGQWPESLEQIKSLVDPNAFVDPQNNSSFVYKLTDDSFTLYSRGPNNIDEGGSRNEPADDWMIWPGGR